MFTFQRLTGQTLTPIPRVTQLGLATCLAIDAGCMAATGMAGLFAFGVAWVVLKVGGVI
jgi:hypothetical protein